MSRLAIHARYRAQASVLDQALRAGGGAYSAPNYADAVVFRHRCYTFMKRYREAEDSPSPYDALIIRALPRKELVNPNLPIFLRIDINHTLGTFIPDTEVEDDLASEARALRDKLGL